MKKIIGLCLNGHFYLNTTGDLHMPPAAAYTQLAAVEVVEHYIPLGAGFLQALRQAVR